MRWWRFIICKHDQTISFGIYATEWNWPLKPKNWEIGIDFYKYSIGLELYK